MKPVRSTLLDPITYVAVGVVLVVGGVIRVLADPSTVTAGTVTGILAAALGLVGFAAVAAARRRGGSEQLPGGEGAIRALAGRAQAAALTAGLLLGVPAILAVGPAGAIAGALLTAVAADALVVLLPSFSLRERTPDEAPVWAQTLILALVNLAVLGIAAALPISGHS